MRNYNTYFVGTEEEVAHHAQPLAESLKIRVVEPTRAGDVAQTGDLAIFFSEHFNRFRQAWFDLNRKGCNTLYAIDGILEWRNAWENSVHEPACPWTMRPVLSDKVACIGPSQARVLQSWGNHGKTEIVGVPRFDLLRPARAPVLPDRFKILVTTAKCPGFTPEQVATITQSLKDIKQFFETNPEIEGKRIELHWRLTSDLHEVLGVENKLRDTTGHDLAECLSQVHSVITTPSTVVLESMIFGLPTCILDYTNSPRYIDAAWAMSARSHIEPMVRQMLLPPPNKQHFQQSLLADALYRDTPASERMLELAQQMIKISHDCREANRPVAFPAHILSIPSTHSDFDRRAMYADLTGGKQSGDRIFQPAGEDLLSAQIDEWRRIIDVQENRIKLLERTVEEANEAIEDVHRHPVLGRILWLSEKIASIFTPQNRRRSPKKARNEDPPKQRARSTDFQP